MILTARMLAAFVWLTVHSNIFSSNSCCSFPATAAAPEWVHRVAASVPLTQPDQHTSSHTIQHKMKTEALKPLGEEKPTVINDRLISAGPMSLPQTPLQQ